MLGAIGVGWTDLLAMPVSAVLLALWGYRQKQRHAELCANVVRAAWAEPYDFEPEPVPETHPSDLGALRAIADHPIIWHTPDGLPPSG